MKYRELTKREHQAIRNLSKGLASKAEQMLALSVIVKNLSATHDIPYVADSQDQTTFRCGRAFVGNRIIYYVNKPVKSDGEKENG